MAGKPSTPESILQRVRDLRSRGVGLKQIEAEVGCSRYTVRKALEGEAFLDRERERVREADAARAAQRAADPVYKAYQAEYGARPERKEQVRRKMAEIRAVRRKGGKNVDA
ncbi:Uncharacterised protein [Starkeya nomas]|uniref:Resolvase HTH domain-containing protein n=1 Tax=Starkeya nomas TaxID=2666134 RepID=A0A5S9R7X8_9HYPH|nr:hypothetical protein [Starkeya nomas]CAA0130290.1 Uncharacterised protein [Starkeya nomas]